MKRILPMIFLFCLLLSLCRVWVYAGDGKLSMDSSVIGQKTGGNRNGEGSTLYQVAPDLFLDEKSKRAGELQEQAEKQLALAREQEFIKEDTKEQFSSNQVLLGLFQQEGIVASNRSQREQSMQPAKMPRWVFAFVAAALVLLATIFGILLGRRYASVFRKKEKKR